MCHWGGPGTQLTGSSNVWNQVTPNCYGYFIKDFYVQVYLEVNLGPIHLLGSLVVRVYDRFNRDYLYKRTYTGAFASINLKEYQLGATVRNRRKREEEKSRFPLAFWTGGLV